MTDFKTAKPAKHGFSAARLSRISDWMAHYVDGGKLPFAETLIARRGEIVFHEVTGDRDVENGLKAEPSGIHRIYSMTKPIVSAAIMQLLEAGKLQLDDPVAKHIPELANLKVLGEDGESTSVARTQPTLHHLLTHTSGLTYGIFDPGPVGKALRKAKIDFSEKHGRLDETVAKLAEIPLVFEPGTRWNYGVSTDVLGRVVETASGMSLAEYLHDHIFGPLGMEDTFFAVPADKLDRFSACYAKTEDEGIRRVDEIEDSRYANSVTMFSGGGGLCSTTFDYLRFMEMIRTHGGGGEDPVLGRKSVEMMLMNHLPGDMASMGQSVFSEMPMKGIGFGLGGSVVLNPAEAQVLGSAGEWAWGGVASTGFWIDPQEEISVVHMTQLMPSSSYPLRRELRTLVYQALVG
ncbi:serine hydrolase domain-containing protein [Nisaea sp.]|uniref:serine hydrolase domain-containing protein n=1 Tax=Nisaea sp. TaxID=2024842 RepID=UPI003B52B423